MNSARFIINFFDMKIIGTKASFNKASKGCGPEYEELAAKMAAHPDYELAVKEPTHRITRVKRTYHGMNFKFMEDYIKIQKDGEQVKKEYEAVKQMADNTGRSVYPITKKWFLDKFGDSNGVFDMEEAQQEISQALIDGAVSSVAPAPARTGLGLTA